jgi:hypothetical protein
MRTLLPRISRRDPVANPSDPSDEKEIDMTRYDDKAPGDQENQIEVIELGDAADLTLGSGGGNSEDKRRIYN